MGCHDAGRTEMNLAVSIPRDRWEPVPGLPHKSSAIVECPHLATSAKVSHPDFFGTETGRITGMTVHHVEGLPTGASLGVVAGHNSSEGFIPLPTNDTVAHVDASGDTHMYHAIVSGRTPKASTTVSFKTPTEFAKEDQIKAKVERWNDVDSAGDMRVFSAKNTEGKSKSLAAIHTGSPLGKLIGRNESNPKFIASTGQIRKVADGDKEHYVVPKEKAEELHTGLNQALAPQTNWAKHPFAFRVFTDSDVLSGTGEHPFNASMTLKRDHATEVKFDDAGNTTAADVVTAGLVDDSEDAFARAVFAGEKGVVKITAGDDADGDGADDV